VRMLTTLSVPTSGTGRVAGFDILRQPTEVRRSLGLTGQAETVDEILTGRENLQLIGSLYGLPKKYVRAARGVPRPAAVPARPPSAGLSPAAPRRPHRLRQTRRCHVLGDDAAPAAR
jgi:hypothetical protein